MTQLHMLKNDTQKRKRKKLLGRGPGSGHGKTSCRGHKGQGSRSGYKKRYGTEGGRMPLFKKLPTRGFTRGRFLKKSFAISLHLIDQFYQDGEVVNLETLYEKGVVCRSLPGGLKVLSDGELTKKVTIEANKFSKEAQKKLEAKSISFKTI